LALYGDKITTPSFIALEGSVLLRAVALESLFLPVLGLHVDELDFIIK
jgi:hypothetical protein